MSRVPEYLSVGVVVLVLLGSGIPFLGWADSEVNIASPGSGGFCPVGQVWPGYDPGWVEPGVITGAGQTFYALFEPGADCSCPVGFRVSTVDFFMTIPDESSFPLTLSVSMGLREAIPDPDVPMSWLPGESFCETPVRDFSIPFPKTFVGFGIALECDCFEMGRPAFLYFTIHSELDPPGGLYTAGGGAPEPGRFFTVVDDQWIDLVTQGTLTRGDLVVSGFARCCEPPVDVDTATWGSLKALYR